MVKSFIKNKLRTLSIDRYPGIFRPSSYPFLTGDSLRNLCDHVFDETQSFKPLEVKENDIVFLKTDLKEIYFDHYHQSIKSKYILVTHNSDISIEKEDLSFLDDKIKHWFAAKLNVLASNKLTALPYGLENRRWLKNGLVKNFKSELSKNINKNERILCSFNPNTNLMERAPLVDIARNKQEIIDIRNFSKNKTYIKELSNYSFNLCPEGNNFESHRIWESLIFKTTPIVINNIVNQNFYNMGIPLIMLDNWNDLSNLDINDLKRINEENLEKNYEIFVNLNFWKSQIISAKS
tara:strand:- start:1623 stop:2501 length:879 start_codon:yes stop_codon:yes gene_type:complete